MKNYKADYVFPVNSDPIKNGMVSIDADGKIIDITADAQKIKGSIEEVSGIICPGFINTHCHLELSHLKNKIARGEGLINFLKSILNSRKTDDTKPEDIIAAAEQADKDMFNNGIVAVGDISNTARTIKIKSKSKLHYHTFIELLGFVPDQAEKIFNSGLDLLEQFKPQSASIAPHAPYTVSKELFKLIKRYSEEVNNVLSIHNQECEDENKFYRYKSGGFAALYESLGIDISYFRPQARNSLQSVLPLLANTNPILLVHNTCTNLKDIYFVKRFDRDIYWCFCPNANLYIEGRLPKINLFVDQNINITLGTDSLASNSSLCILSEMRTIQEAYPTIGLPTLIKWATLNGADFLGIAHDKGSIELGKTPGLNLLTNIHDLKITADTKVQRLV